MLTAALLSLALAPWVPAAPPQPTSGADSAGEWAIVVDYDERQRLTAQVTRPDGTVLRKVLDRARDTADPVADIDAHGNALVAWRVDGRLRTASGPQLTRGPELPRALDVDVDVSPGGRTLLAWSTADGGTFAQIDGGAPLRIAEVPAFEVEAAINDAGAALVAHHSFRPGPILVNDRAPDGPWAAPRDVSGGHAVPYVDEAGIPPALSSTLSPDGRAALTWSSPRHGLGRVFAVTGLAGGTWDQVEQLSSPLFSAGYPSAALDAAGRPLVSWDEAGLSRAATPVVGAVPDTTPLTVTADLPGPLPRVRSGEVTVTARVHCSKPCTAQLLMAGHLHPPQDVPADTDTVVRGRFHDPRLMAPGHSGRLRVGLVVTDRAGHVARRVRTFRVRVVRPPLRSLKVADSHSFAMFTPAGNRAVGRLVNAVIEGLASGEIKSLRELRARWRAGTAALDRAGHDEHYETACRDEIGLALYEPLMLAGYDVESVIL